MWIFATMYGSCTVIGAALVFWIKKRQTAAKRERELWNEDIDGYVEGIE